MAEDQFEHSRSGAEPGAIRRHCLLRATWGQVSTFDVSIHVEELQLLGQNRHTEIARLDALHNAQLQHLHYLFNRRTELERSLDVAVRTCA